MSAQDVEPLANDMGKPEGLRDLIHAARHDAPSEEQLGSLMSRLEQIESGAVAGAGGGLLKLLPIIGALALVVGGTLWTLGRESNPQAAPVLSQSVEERSVDVEPEIEALVHLQAEQSPRAQQAEPVIEEAPENAAPQRHVPARKAAPAAMPPAASEPELVQAARRALQSRAWRQSMRLVRTHEMQYPQGILSEEREAIAVETLASSGELEMARTRLRAMSRSYPGSSYRAHLEGLPGLGSE